MLTLNGPSCDCAAFPCCVHLLIALRDANDAFYVQLCMHRATYAARATAFSNDTYEDFLLPGGRATTTPYIC
jgi:hypothetical protein